VCPADPGRGRNRMFRVQGDVRAQRLVDSNTEPASSRRLTNVFAEQAASRDRAPVRTPTGKRPRSRVLHLGEGTMVGHCGVSSRVSIAVVIRARVQRDPSSTRRQTDLELQAHRSPPERARPKAARSLHGCGAHMRLARCSGPLWGEPRASPCEARDRSWSGVAGPTWHQPHRRCPLR
jgi:hypothetical protein